MRTRELVSGGVKGVSQALYRKYRSKNLSEVIGQDHITRTLGAALKSGKISHAYLFTGPKGTGKTSIARILAHEINNLEYTDDQSIHLDIIEIDAASNRRIDEIRDLRDKVHIAPTSAKYKVYIIDEVHMLTKEAFNALLKTLEEPPAHVVFILATTELQKVPETIVSRTQRYVFKAIGKDDIVGHLETIAKKEGIMIDKEALSLIADHAAGGFRDAISLLDQVRNYGDEITAQTVSDALGIVPTEKITTLWQAVVSNDLKAARESLHDLFDAGVQAVPIARALVDRAIDEGNSRLARLFLQASGSKEAKTELVLALLDAVENQQSTTIVQKSSPTPPTEAPKAPEKNIHKEVSSESKAPEPPVAAKTLVVEHKALEPTPIPSETATESPKVEPIDESVAEDESTEKNSEEPSFWGQVLNTLKESGHGIYAPLRLAKPELKGKSLTLSLDFPFHIKKLQEANNLTHLLTIIQDIAGTEISVHFQKTQKEAEKPAETPKKSVIIEQPDSTAEPLPNPLDMVKNIFGNAELM